MHEKKDDDKKMHAIFFFWGGGVGTSSLLFMTNVGENFSRCFQIRSNIMERSRASGPGVERLLQF